MLRFGSVPYLNARPLLAGLADEAGPVRTAVPSELTRLLRQGELDVALAPVVAAFEDPSLVIVPGGAVGSRGPVESVLLFCRMAPPDCRTVALDTSSRTSSNLVRVLFRNRWGRMPAFRDRGPDPDLSHDPADAVLLIGDACLRVPRPDPRDTTPPPLDLGAEWFAWTGLPFVFACWVARSPEAAAEASEIVRRAAERGQAEIEAIAAAGAEELGLELPRMRTYLRERLSYRFGDEERRGLERFRELWAGLRVRS